MIQRVEIDDSFPQVARSIRVVEVNRDRSGPAKGRTIRRKSLTPMLVVRQNPWNGAMTDMNCVTIQTLALSRSVGAAVE